MLFREIIEIKTKGELDVVDITNKVQKIVERSGIEEGICLIFGKGSTVSVIVNENDSMLLEDLKKTIVNLVPEKNYNHPINARSHLRTVLLGNHVCLSVNNGNLQIGTWQQIMVVELDVRPRKREITITIVGE